MKLSLLICLNFALFVFLCAPLDAFAATGDNCRINLTTDVPENQDWNGVYIIRGDDGSAWQRGIISNPVENFPVREGKTANITAMVTPFADTAFFIYAATQSPGSGLAKPDDGVCFEGPQGNETGGVVFPIHSRLLLGAIDNDLVIDVYYRLDTDWDRLYGEKTNFNFFLGTFMFPKTVKVLREIVPTPKPRATPMPTATPVDNKDKPVQLPMLDPPTIPAPPSFNPGIAAAQGSGESRVFSEDSHCQFTADIAADSPVSLFYTLDPFSIDSRLLGNNFDAVGGNAVDIGRSDSSSYIHYTRATDSTAKTDASERRRIAQKSHILEGIKRLLEGGTLAPDAERYAIGALTNANLTQNVESNEIVKAVKTILTGDKDTNAAARVLSKSFQTLLIGVENSYDVTAKLFLELFPPVSSVDAWSDDFLNILNFWTGSTAANSCVLDTSSSISENFRKPELSLSKGGWDY